jgi:RNA-binding protein
MSLSSKATRYLRGLAHHLKPVILVGDKGLSAAVVHAACEALEHHELIKCKVAGDRDDVKEAADSLVIGTGGALVQIIGKTIVLYKAREEDPEITLPK